MDDIKDPAGKEPLFDNTPPPSAPPLKPVHPESERRGGLEAEPEDE
jgi:hypothetical protein